MITVMVLPHSRRARGHGPPAVSPVGSDAIGVNQVIGSGIFRLPADLAASAGAWSPFLVAGVGLASLLIALCFAEVSSRFDATGGSYLYTRAAFGRFLSFEVGWMLWFTRATSHATVVNGLALALGYYWPALAAAPRASADLAVTAVDGRQRAAFAVRLANALTASSPCWSASSSSGCSPTTARAAARRHARAGLTAALL
jgi:amino acid transporter